MIERPEIGPSIEMTDRATRLRLIAVDLLFAAAEGAQVSTVTDVLFSCYEVVVQVQGFGRRITLEHQRSSSACLDLIREQKKLVLGR